MFVNYQIFVFLKWFIHFFVYHEQFFEWQNKFFDHFKIFYFRRHVKDFVRRIDDIDEWKKWQNHDNFIKWIANTFEILFQKIKHLNHFVKILINIFFYEIKTSLTRLQNEKKKKYDCFFQSNKINCQCRSKMEFLMKKKLIVFMWKINACFWITLWLCSYITNT